jgi:hypothetical protein
MKLIEEIASGLSGSLMIFAWSKNPVFAPYILLVCALIGLVLSLYYTPKLNWKERLKTGLISVAVGCIAGLSIWNMVPWAAYGLCAGLTFLANIAQLKKHALA